MSSIVTKRRESVQPSPRPSSERSQNNFPLISTRSTHNKDLNAVTSHHYGHDLTPNKDSASTSFEGNPYQIDMAVSFKKPAETKQSTQIAEPSLKSDTSVKILVQRISEMRISEEGESKLSVINKLQ
jgi:hypothetical protein